MPASAQKKAPAKKKAEPEVQEEQALAKAPALTMPRFGLAEEHRNVWRAIVPTETLPDQILDEAFWSNVSRLLQPGDEIQVLPDDYRWRRDLHVVATGNNWTQVVTLTHFDLASKQPREAVPSRYQTHFAGAHHKWRVLLDGNPIKDGFASEKLARQWAAQHEDAGNR